MSAEEISLIISIDLKGAFRHEVSDRCDGW